MNNFLFSLNATVPVFAVIVLGHFFKRIGLIDEHFASVANKFVFKACLPCLVFQDLADTNIRKNFDFKYVGFCFIATLTSILVVWFLAKKFMRDKSMVGAFVQGAYRSSAAILGIAFIQNIYGTSGMAPLMIIGSVPLYNIFAVIILTLESNNKENFGDNSRIKHAMINILKNPIIIGIFFGLAASFLNISFPRMIDKTINNLAVMASPLALISIGATFEGRKALAKIKPTMAAYFGFRDQKLIAIVIMLASPCTPTSYIMAKNMDGDDTLAASIVVSTTLFSSVTLTGWIFLMKSLSLIQ